MQQNEDDEMMGFCAAIRWLFGTNAEMETDAAKDEAMREVGQPFRQEPSPMSIERATSALDRLEKSQERLDRAFIPAKNLDEALTQMLGGRE